MLGDVYIVEGMFGIGFRGVFTALKRAMFAGEEQAELAGNKVAEWKECGDGSWCAALECDIDHCNVTIWRCKLDMLVDVC